MGVRSYAHGHRTVRPLGTCAQVPRHGHRTVRPLGAQEPRSQWTSASPYRKITSIMVDFPLPVPPARPTTSGLPPSNS